MSNLTIRHATLITPTGPTRADLQIENERITQIAPHLPPAPHDIDATGLTVFPGLIDIHLHFNEPGRADWEGASTGSRALAAGGGTLFFDMPLNSTPCTVSAPEFDRKRHALEAASITDFALWGGLIPGNLADLDELAARGVIGFKAFLCDSGLPEFPRVDDLTLYEGMQRAAQLGLPVAVHAESEEITKALQCRITASGRSDIKAFLESRPVIAEVEAITRASTLARATGCKLHIVHISSGKGVAAALEARSLGADISLETCPHYLLFTADDLLRLGAIAKCTPPLRDAAEHTALLEAVQNGAIDHIASDHSPCPPAMKARDNFFEIWGGIAGVQWTLPALIEKGLTPDRIAALTAANGAARFNISDRGAITLGNYADLALIDLNATQTVTEEILHHRHRITPYLGMNLRGVVRKTIRRGEVIYSEGTITASTHGQLITPTRKANAASRTHP
jgi:allantoinase